MGEKDGYASLIKQLTSPQITLPSGKFNCVRKRCDYGPISFESESAKSMCNHTCIKNGPHVQPNKSRFKHKHKTWAYAMGTIWEPWQSQLSLLQKRILVRLTRIILVYPQRPGFLSHLMHTVPFLFFTPKPSLKIQSQIQNPP